MTGCASNESKPDGSTTSGVATASASDVPAPGTPAQTSAAPDAAHVKFGSTDVGPVTTVGCQTDGGVTTITVDAAQKTTVVLTDEDTPAVKSVSIGEAGSGPSLMFLEGVTAPPQASREDKKFTVSGSGMGTDAANPDVPVEMPFEIAVSCP
jgi:lipoprotein LpqH